MFVPGQIHQCERFIYRKSYRHRNIKQRYRMFSKYRAALPPILPVTFVTSYSLCQKGQTYHSMDCIFYCLDDFARDITQLHLHF